MTTPSLTNPNPKREDEREAKATDVIGYLNVYRDDDGDLVTGSSDLCATAEEAADFAASEFKDHVGVFALVPAASARPSLGDPVRAALAYTSVVGDAGASYLKSVSLDGEYHLSGTFRWHELFDAMMAAALSVSTPTGEGEAQTEFDRGMAFGWKSASGLIQTHRDMQEKATVRALAAESALAALAHPQQGGERDGWKLIDDTAPKDRYILTSIAGRHEVTRSHWNNGIWTGWGVGDCPTHWMPLPTAPTSPSESSGEEA